MTDFVTGVNNYVFKRVLTLQRINDEIISVEVTIDYFTIFFNKNYELSRKQLHTFVCPVRRTNYKSGHNCSSHKKGKASGRNIGCCEDKAYPSISEDRIHERI